MMALKSKERIALKSADVINRGKDSNDHEEEVLEGDDDCNEESEKKKEKDVKDKKKIYTYEVPETYPGCEGLCLPLSLILACIIELGIKLKKRPFKQKAEKLVLINDESENKVAAACELLLNEFDFLKSKIKGLRSLKDFTFNNTCPSFQQYYKVNILIHSNALDLDELEYRLPQEYDPSLPRYRFNQNKPSGHNIRMY